jgi:protein-ribulosamine 3-kinase
MTERSFAAALSEALGCDVAPRPEAAVHGGCIGDCYRWQAAAGPVFVKRCDASHRWILDAEQDGLGRLARTGALRVPAALAAGDDGESAFLVLEWLELRPPDGASDAGLGRALARLHAVTAPAFGLERDNAIGGTPQPNAPLEAWPDFWRERRLGFQLGLAARGGHAGRLQERGQALLERVPALFAGHRPRPSLLHGDLWAGNRARLQDGAPAAFDPAVYYGDREADLAMTRLFGGFGRDFYDAYDAEWPPDPGAPARRDLYNLYHVLNHLNLFGGGYRAQAEAMIERLLAAA